MYGYIYKTTNLINNKNYIGQHKSKIFDSYKGSGIKIKKAMKKYGVENFKTEILVWCESKEELNKQEIKLIKEYREKGEAQYNLSDGGEGSLGIILKGKDNPFYGNTHSEEVKNKLSYYAKKRTGKNNPFYGKKMTKEHLEKTRRTGSKQSKETRDKISKSLSKKSECDICNAQFDSIKEMKQHRQKSHHDIIKNRMSERASKRNSEIFTCPFCNKVIKSKGNLTQHIRANHD